MNRSIPGASSRLSFTLKWVGAAGSGTGTVGAASAGEDVGGGEAASAMAEMISYLVSNRRISYSTLGATG